LTWAATATGSRNRVVQRFGGGATVTIRRHHTLVNRSTGDAVSKLALDGAVTAGDSTLSLKKQHLVGDLPIGITFKLAGDATTYTTTNAVKAESSALADVTFSPVAAANAATEIPVLLQTEYADYSFLASSKRFRREEVDGSTVQTGDRQIALSALAEPVAIDDQDQVIFNGKLYAVVGVDLHTHGSTNTGTTLHVRGV
jgi:hypothetical protein